MFVVFLCHFNADSGTQNKPQPLHYKAVFLDSSATIRITTCQLTNRQGTWSILIRLKRHFIIHFLCSGLDFFAVEDACVVCGRSSWLQIQRSGFDSRHYQIFWKVVGLERGPISLVSTTEELFGRNTSGFALESREYGRRDPSRWPSGTLYPQKLALTSVTSRCRSVGIVRSRTQATGFSFYFSIIIGSPFALSPKSILKLSIFCRQVNCDVFPNMDLV
jgi:hypothetical protein